MCLGVPARVLEVDGGGTAVVDVGGVRQRASLVVLEAGGTRVAPGDWLLLHTGLAVEQLDEGEAREILALIAGMEGAT